MIVPPKAGRRQQRFGQGGAGRSRPLAKPWAAFSGSAANRDGAFGGEFRGEPPASPGCNRSRLPMEPRSRLGDSASR